MDQKDMEKELAENTKLTKAIHTLLAGVPEYGQPGLVDDVHKMKQKVEQHDHILVRYGGGLATILILMEVLHYFYDHAK